jgi:phosphohistidine swiveling domain-containing protein
VVEGVKRGDERGGGRAANMIPMVDLGIGEYLSETPSIRFPVYTRGNAGEVWPDVVYPLSVSMTRGERHDPFSKPMLESGLVVPADLADGITTMGGVFGGYMYLNVSLNRMIAIRMPGVTMAEADATYLGSDSIAPPHVPHPDDKNRRASWRGLRYGWKMLGATDVPHLAGDRAFVTGWEQRLPTILSGPTEGLVAAVRELVDPTIDMFSRHVEVTGKAGAAVQMLTGICRDRLGDPSLALTMLGGLGEVDSAAPSFALWRLGRLVSAAPELTAQFDQGLDGLADRLAGDPAAGAFEVEFAAFRQTYGSRGPNEWETACETWGTDPALVLALVDRMRLAGADHDPSIRAQSIAVARLMAVDNARAGLSWPYRWFFDRVLRAAMLYSPARERSKTIIVDLIHVGRRMLRELGTRCMAGVEGGRMHDIWFVFEHELDAYVADPASMRDVVATRRAARDELVRREPPFVFSGPLPSPDTWPLRSGRTAGARLAVGESLTGLGGCAGVAAGRARIVTDPGDPGDLGPGDVLIAPLTDPAWTPLFVPVEAIVVDVGGQMSHAVIVSRELGRPCVVAATGATARIPDGALVRVDGSAGTVTVIEDPAGAP